MRIQFYRSALFQILLLQFSSHTMYITRNDVKKIFVCGPISGYERLIKPRGGRDV